MSLKPIDLTPIPEETARIAKSALPKGNIYLKLRDELGALYRVLSVTGLYLSHALPNVSDYEEPVPEPPYRCAPDEKLPQAQGYIWDGMRRTGSAPQQMATLNIRLCFYFDKNRTLVKHKLEQIETY